MEVFCDEDAEGAEPTTLSARLEEQGRDLSPTGLGLLVCWTAFWTSSATTSRYDEAPSETWISQPVNTP